MKEQNQGSNDALEARLSAARERKRGAESKRAAMQSEGEMLALVEAEEIEARDAEALAEAEEKHGAKRIRVVETELGNVIVKRPNAVLYKRFRDNGSSDTQAFEKLVRPSLVHPSPEEFDRILDETPGTLDRCANAVVELAGFRAKEVSAK